MFLSDQQLEELTGKTQHAAQIRALVRMRVPHRVRPDGRPLVLPADLQLQSTAKRKQQEPDYSAIIDKLAS